MLKFSPPNSFATFGIKSRYNKILNIKPMGFIGIYVTHESLEEAKNMSFNLIEKKLVACSNLFPINSMYFWKGEISDTDEIVSLLKTRKENWELVQEEIKKLHKYEIPCIIKIDLEANKDYEDWILQETNI